MATLLAHIRIKPGCVARFEAIVRDLYAASHASEPALLRYEYWRGEEPGLYYCFESFDDYAGFIAHEVGPHHEEAAQPLMDLVADFRLEWVDPLHGAAPLPETADAPPHADWGERERFYAEMFPHSVAAWWRRAREESKEEGAVA